MTRRPLLLDCSTGNNGNPASLRASKPEANANEVAMSKASTSFLSIPYCSVRSNLPPIPANCGTFSKVSAGTSLDVPSSLLTNRTIFWSTSFCFISLEISEMRFLPSKMASQTPSSKTSSMPGTPSEIPLTTGGSGFASESLERFSGSIEIACTMSATVENEPGPDMETRSGWPNSSRTYRILDSSTPISSRLTFPVKTELG